MDQYAMTEGAILVGNDPGQAAIEMAGYGGRFHINNVAVIAALSGAPMLAKLDGNPIPWRTSFKVNPGQTLEIGAALGGPSAGTYGYLHVAGGIAIDKEIGARSTHLRAGIGGTDGKPLQAGACLPVGQYPTDSFIAQRLPEPEYLGQRRIRLMWGAHAHRFNQQTRQRLLSESFCISLRRDRMAMRLELDQTQLPFEALLTGLSDPVQDGDIQMTGDGIPAILVREHQPTGGYPRIATVIRADLTAVAQLPTAITFQFELVNQKQAVDALKQWRTSIDGLVNLVQPVVRSVDQIDNLLAYNLIGGVVSAEEEN